MKSEYGIEEKIKDIIENFDGKNFYKIKIGKI